MRFIVFMIPNRKNYEAGVMPSDDDMNAMTAFNEKLLQAGVLLGGDGFAPPKDGARLEFPDGKPLLVTDAPPPTKEVIGGYWIWRTRSLESAIEWARQCPAAKGDVLEIRRIFEMEDFAPGEARDRAYALAEGEQKNRSA